jgi:soluble lytic murein transglycosylase
MFYAPWGLRRLLLGLSFALTIAAVLLLTRQPANGTVERAAMTPASALVEAAIEGPVRGIVVPEVPAKHLAPAPVWVTTALLTDPPTGTFDSFVTGSVDLDAKPQPEVGTAEFRTALAALVDGDAVKAYDLAKSLDDSAERRALQWAAIYYGDGVIDFASVIRFSADAPAFSETDVFKTRLEQALMRAGPEGAEIIEHLGGAMPNTVDARIALALAYVEAGEKDRAVEIARSIWTTEFLTKASENRVYKKLGKLLTDEDHWARAVHLMMHDRATGVERLMQFMTPAQKSLAVARNAVSRHRKNAKDLLDKVDPSMQTHPVFLFSRAQRARQFELWDDAVAWLDKATGDVPDAGEFWLERRTLVRQLLALGMPKLAFVAADGYRSGPEPRLADAHFHAGWIALSFLKDAEAALPHFEAMRELATLPESSAQAYYWVGRTKLALGDKLGSNEAYGAASRYGTIFYGLMARAELGLGAQIRSMPAWEEAITPFEENDVVEAIRLLAGNGQKEKAMPLLRSFAFGLDDGGELLLAAQLAQSLGNHDLAIRIAENADKRGMPLDLFAFPKDGLPKTHLADVDHAAIYAITRQESHFQIDAVSSAGARGLMQLMPGTARETAAKVGLPYSKTRLTTDGAYNALLGSTYLATQLATFDRSLVLAAAAYNAGPGNARKWIRANGDPRLAEIDPVTWIEQIPVQETRNYVKKVLGNYLVYRARLGDTELTLSEALRKIP